VLWYNEPGACKLKALASNLVDGNKRLHGFPKFLSSKKIYPLVGCPEILCTIEKNNDYYDFCFLSGFDQINRENQ